MKTIFLFAFVVVFFIRCNDDKKIEVLKEDKRIALRTDSINVARLADTLVIYESTCRGCEYEGSTRFDISDSLGIIKLLDVITNDNNSADTDGGSISKELVLVPLKIGTTTIKQYKFWSEKTASQDSARFKTYTIEVRN
ncbi:MAG: hypothetical protein ABI666_11250 [Ferruginibacter sp.]